MKKTARFSKGDYVVDIDGHIVWVIGVRYDDDGDVSYDVIDPKTARWPKERKWLHGNEIYIDELQERFCLYKLDVDKKGVITVPIGYAKLPPEEQKCVSEWVMKQAVPKGLDDVLDGFLNYVRNAPDSLYDIARRYNDGLTEAEIDASLDWLDKFINQVG